MGGYTTLAVILAADFTTVGLVGAAILFFYFVAIRPQAKRAKEQMTMTNSLEPGTRIMTTAGIFATVVHVGQQQVVLEISPGVEMTMLKAGIARVVNSDEDEFEYDDDVVDQINEDDASDVGSANETDTTEDSVDSKDDSAR